VKTLGPLDLTDLGITGYVLALVDGVEVNRRALSEPEFSAYLREAQDDDGDDGLAALADELVSNPPGAVVELVLISTAGGVVGTSTRVSRRVPDRDSLWSIANELRTAAGWAVADDDDKVARRVGWLLVALACEVEDGTFLSPTTVKRARLLAADINTRYTTAKGKKK
jgi:hypothetical protein